MKPSTGAMFTVFLADRLKGFRATCGDPGCRFVTACYVYRNEAKGALMRHRRKEHA